MEQTNKNSNDFILAYCGLVCSNCGAYKKGRCHSCHSEKPMYRNCPVKKCALEKSYTSCADCGDFENLKDCKKLNNFISKIFDLVFRTDRIGNLDRIREVGVEQFQQQS